jgi:uncharacterized protein DUF4397
MKRILTAGLLSLAAVAAGGCGNGSGFDVSNSARVRAVNAVSAGATLAISIGGNRIADNLGYSQATDYNGVDAGEQEVVVQTVVGQVKLVDQQTAFTAGADYTMLVVGQQTNVSLLNVTDDNSPPPTGQAKFRVINVIPGNLLAFDVYFTAPGADLTAATPTLTNITSGNASSYAALAAGTYQVRITPAGGKTAVVDAGTLTLNAGDIRTALVLPAPGGGPPFSAVLLTGG